MATSKACHNCRKRRLRCDRSVPTCNKCTATGQECQGYGKAYRWTNSVASRGRMAGKSSFSPTSADAAHPERQPTPVALIRDRQSRAAAGRALSSEMPIVLLDPSFQHMNSTSRFYLNYFSTRMCPELVTHDSARLNGNPFRELIAMSTSYSFLESILVASSAMHYSNLMRRTSHDWPGSSKAAVDALVEALHARHDAIKGVQTVLARHKASANNTRASDEKDALLATILFFINFALIDSGKGGWRAHMRAARNLIAAQASNFVILTNKIQEDADAEHSVLAISSLHIRRTAISRDLQQTTSLIRPQNPIGIRDYIASDSVAYYIWGTTLDALSNSAAGTPGTSIVDSDEIRYIIDRTEANSYHSCPAQLLLLILRISRLAQRISVIGNAPVADPEMSLFVDYLEEAQNFNPAEWAIRVSTANAYVREVDELEIKMRTYIAAAYRASVCLYVLLAAPGLQQYMERHSSVPGDTMNLSTLPTTEDLTKEILSQLMLIPSTYPLFKYTTWPVFMTGVEAVAPERRSWIIQRLSAMWELCPWGMMKSAMETLTEIWQLRDGLSVSTSDDDAIAGGSIADMTDRNWLIHLRNMGSNLLIV